MVTPSAPSCEHWHFEQIHGAGHQDKGRQIQLADMASSLGAKDGDGIHASLFRAEGMARAYALVHRLDPRCLEPLQQILWRPVPAGLDHWDPLLQDHLYV
jgi:hypothetical protein